MVAGENMHTVILTNLVYPVPNSISFFGLMPDEFSESHSAEFETIGIMSRSNPLASYTSSSARGTSISIDLHEDYLAEFNGGSSDTDISQYVAKIKALTYPRYDGVLVIPPKVQLKIGTFFKILGYCNSCDVTWRKPIRDGRYISATVTFSITEALPKALSAEQIFLQEELKMF